ncbi:MAG: FkbM family methyltransferase [Nitrospirae bacterium]|nr:FkbM family methyltransferase [Nitrospirota bacterium]
MALRSAPIASKAFWALRALADLPPRSDLETYTRLGWLFSRGWPRRDGRFRFSFGQIEYVHALSLLSQFECIFLDREYDVALPTDRPLILDCGAHVGMATIRFKHLFPRARIIAFEADPAIERVLERNVASLGLADVTCLKSAVWIERGHHFFRADGADGGHLAPADGGLSVPTVDLADYVTDTVHVLKLDIEGAEMDVLDHLDRKNLLGRVHVILCEFHIRSASDNVRLGSLLVRLSAEGFRFSLGWARPAPYLAAEPDPTPFPALPSGALALQFYAWRPAGAPVQ